MHKRISLLILVFVGLSGWLPAQETLTSDPAPATAFSGQVSYQITYEGKLSYAQKRWLPDSMLVMAKAPMLRIQYFGGMSDTLLHDIYWDSTDESYLLLDHANQTAYYPERPGSAPAAKRKQLKEDLTILEHACEAWSVTLPGESNKIWLSEDLIFPLPAADSSGRVLAPVFFQAGLTAIPLKTIRNYQGVVVTTTATAISDLPADAGDLQIPSGYSKTSFEGQMGRHPLTRD